MPIRPLKTQYYYPDIAAIVLWLKCAVVILILIGNASCYQENVIGNITAIVITLFLSSKLLFFLLLLLLQQQLNRMMSKFGKKKS